MTVPVVLAAFWLACGLTAIALVWRASRRPINQTDEYCSRVDSELDGSWPVVADPFRDVDAVVFEFPRRPDREDAA